MYYHSPQPDVTVPDLSLTSFVLDLARESGEKTAVVDGSSGHRLTYRALWHAIRGAAANLASQGFRPGDVLGICLPNLPEYPAIFHAVAILGGISTTINPTYTADEMAFQLRDSGARFVVSTPELRHVVSAAADSSGIERILILGGGDPVASLATLSVHESGFIDEMAPIKPREDVVVLPYSSGTTGLPKGVMLTHYNLVANLCQLRTVHQIIDSDVILAALPFFHSYGLSTIMNLGLSAGATLVTMPRFDFEQALRIIQDYRITRADLVPPILISLAKEPMVERYDLSSLRIILCGAAPLSSSLMETCSARLGCVVKQGYGLTEASPATHITPDDPAKNKFGSVGPPLPSTVCVIIDTQTATPVDPYAIGEILIRGPQIMKGYLNKPEATAQVIDDEGWLHTGDVGYCDEEGYLYVIDRLKEVIKYKGHQVAPAELEAVLLTHPAIADAAVVRSADSEAGEVPKAYVVRAKDISPEDIMQFVAERVAPFKKIRRVAFVRQIPRSAAGKILRRELRDEESTGTKRNEAGR